MTTDILWQAAFMASLVTLAITMVGTLITNEEEEEDDKNGE